MAESQALIDSLSMIGRWVFLAAYTSSGVAGLVYEVVWTRLLTLYMGHTIAAASTVTAAFMGGLGIGAVLGGRAASRLTARQALYAYAMLESVALLSAIAIPFCLAALTPAFSWAYRDGHSPVLFPLVRIFSSLAVLLVPSVALGGTFPLAVRCFVHASSHAGGAAGRLYAANTAGAAVGSLAAGFLLIPAIGLIGTTLVGMAASGLSVAAVLALAHRKTLELSGSDTLGLPRSSESTPLSTSRRTRKVRSPEQSPQRHSAGYSLAIAVLSMTGFATFLYEIAWTRIFAMSVGPSTYAFSATLTSFIVGLAVGAFVGAAAADRIRLPAVGLAITLGGTAVAACCASWLAGGPLLYYVVEQLAGPAQEPTAILLRHTLIIMALTAPIALGLGTAFPLALDLAGAGDGPLARRMGTVYAVNTFTAVAGALTAGFVAIPLLGLQRTLLLATIVLVLSACVVVALGISSTRHRVASMLPVAAALVFLMEIPAWDRQMLASGAYLYTQSIPEGLDVETALKAGTLLFYREGATATVSVKRLAGDLSLAIDGKVDASTSGDMLTQKTLAHLPLLMHPNPHEVAIVGLGSGVTVASALVHPVSSVDVIEISREVVEASQLFSTVNRNALDDPRTRLVLGDGRAHLSLASRRYDVIISEPSNPWMAGVAALFTREFFLSARSRLTPDGIFCQWAHTYAIGEDDLRSIVATFGSVFPNGTMWLIGDGDLLLVGAADSLEPRFDNIELAWRRRGVAADLLDVSMAEPFSLLSLFVGGPEELRRYAGGAPLQTDDRMALEFSSPFALYGDRSRSNTLKMRQSLSDAQRPPAVARAFAHAGAAQWRGRAAMLMKAGAHDIAYQDYLTSLELVPTDAGALAEFVPAALSSHREADAVARLEGWLSRYPKTAALWIALSKLHAGRGSFDQAIHAAMQACTIELTAASLEQLASLYADLGDTARLDQTIETLQSLFPQGFITSYYLATSKFQHGQFSDALPLTQIAIQIDPRRAAAHNLLGAIHASLGQTQQARAAFQAALGLDPRDSTTYTNLALLEMTSGGRLAAAALFAEALTLDPDSSMAREGLLRAGANAAR